MKSRVLIYDYLPWIIIIVFISRWISIHLDLYVYNGRIRVIKSLTMQQYNIKCFMPTMVVLFMVETSIRPMYNEICCFEDRREGRWQFLIVVWSRVEGKLEMLIVAFCYSWSSLNKHLSSQQSKSAALEATREKWRGSSCLHHK